MTFPKLPRLPQWMYPYNEPDYPTHMVLIFWICFVATVVGFAGVMLSCSSLWVMIWFGWELFFGINICYIAMFRPVYFKNWN